MLWLALLLAMTPPAAPRRSLSIGNASDGVLVDGQKLALRGASWEVMRATQRRGYHWGTDELVGAIERASGAVARRFPGSMLLVGNMSREGGGDIGPSVSHNSGRDVDLGFYAMDARGRPVRTPTLVVFDERGQAGELRFDVRRNWSLVKAFLTDGQVQVQWIFCKNALRRRLLAHAQEAGEPADLVARADAVLGEPGNSSAHSEHFHVRLYCARHDRLGGCRNYGPTHAWIDDYQKDVDALARSLVPALVRSDREALEAIGRIGLIRGAVVGGDLVAVVEDARRSPAVRLAALDALQLLDGLEAHAPRLAARLQDEKDAALLAALARVVAHVAAPTTAPQLVSLVQRRAPANARIAAAQGLGRMLHAEAVPVLGALLGDRAVADAADAALQRIAGRSFGRGAKAVARWAAWWKVNGTQPRVEWLWAALGEQGVKRPKADAAPRQRLAAVRRLVGLMRAGGARATTARELVRELTGYWLEQGHFTDHQMFRFYSYWLRSGAPSPG